MWHAEHSLQTTTEPEDIWRRWTDVAGWPEWDEALEWARLEGPMAVGSIGSYKPFRSGAQSFKVVDVQEGRSFTCVGHRWMADLKIHHRIEPSEFGSRLTHRVEVDGPLAWWLHFTLGHQLRDTLPKALRKLARVAGQP